MAKPKPAKKLAPTRALPMELGSATDLSTRRASGRSSAGHIRRRLARTRAFASREWANPLSLTCRPGAHERVAVRRG